MIEINDNTTIKDVEDSLTPTQKKVADVIANFIFKSSFFLASILDAIDRK